MSPRAEARLPGIVLTVLGVLFCAGALSYGVVVDGRMGPGMVPTVTGLGLIVLGLLIVLAERSASGSQEEDATDDGGAAGGEPDGGDDGADAPTDADEQHPPAGETPVLAQKVQHPARPWFILAATVTALLLAPVVGLIPGLGLMAFVVLRFVEGESWRLAIGVTVALVFISWLIFEEFLDVNLPWGVFGGFM